MKSNEDVSLNDKGIFLKETNLFEKDLDSIILRIKVSIGNTDCDILIIKVSIDNIDCIILRIKVTIDDIDCNILRIKGCGGVRYVGITPTRRR